MAGIKLTDQVGVDVEVELNKESALGKYLQNPTSLKLNNLKFEGLEQIPLDQAPLKRLDTGINFEQEVGLGVDDAELTIGAGLSGAMKLYTLKDEQLFDPDVFGDAIPVREGELYLSVQARATLSADVSAEKADLTFGFAPGTQTVLTSYNKFEKQGGAFPSCKDALTKTIASFAIPGDLQDLLAMDIGSVATIEGTGSLKVSGSVDLLTVVNPLAVAGLPDPIGELKLVSTGSIKIGAALQLSGGYQVRVQKIDVNKAHLGYYKKKGTELTVKASATLGLSAGVGKFDIIENLLKAISSDPKVESEKLRKEGLTKEKLTDAQIDAIKTALEAGAARKLELAAIFELGSQDSSEAAFLYEIDLSLLTEPAKGAIHKALDGDLSDVSESSLPGIKAIRSIFTETKKEKHSLKLNLLGIYNYVSISTLVLKGTMVLDHQSGELTLTDTATASLITVSTNNFLADSEKLRKVLAESVLVTIAYSASKLITHPPKLKVAHSYLEIYSKTNRTTLKNNLDVFEALRLMSKKDKEQLVESAVNFGSTVFNVQVGYEEDVATALFLVDGKSRSVAEYEKIGRDALALLVQEGESDDFRRRPMVNEKLWNQMRKIGSDFTLVEELKNLSAEKIGAIKTDYLVIVWWAKAMHELGEHLAGIRDFISSSNGVDPEDNTFKSLRKKLAAKLKDVASKTKREFGDPWGLLAMDLASSQKAKVTASVWGPKVMLLRSRNS